MKNTVTGMNVSKEIPSLLPHALSLAECHLIFFEIMRRNMPKCHSSFFACTINASIFCELLVHMGIVVYILNWGPTVFVLIIKCFYKTNVDF